MRWTRQKIIVGTCAVIAAIGLAVALVIVLPGSSTPAKSTPTDSPVGIRPPYAESTGTGTGTVLRGGRAYAIRWSRPDANGGTTFTTLSGQPMTFARGQVWVVFAAAP